MENIIKNLHKITQYLTDEQVGTLEHSGLMHRRFSRIYFKILNVDEENKVLNIQINQEKSPHENYATGKRLTEIVEETFREFFADWQIRKVTYPYQEAPPEMVTPEWIKEQMTKHKISSKKIVEDTGVAKAEISALINGHREMGMRTKGLFYYYFKYLETQK